jgi:hypothetical protein
MKNSVWRCKLYTINMASPRYLYIVFYYFRQQIEYLMLLSRDICVTIDGIWLVNGFIDHLCTRLGTTSNYNATANLHNSQITAALSKRLPACCLHQPLPTTASNSGESSASRAHFLSSVQNCLNLTNELTTNIVPCLKHLGTDHIENTALQSLR